MGFPRIHRLLALAWVVAVIASGSCILYTGKINRPPVGASIVPLSPLWRGKPIDLGGIAFDPDGDVLTFDWATSPGTCPIAPVFADMPAVAASGITFSVQVDDMAPLCVWLRVTDSSGSRAPLALMTVVAMNQAPTAIIQRQQPAGNPLTAFPLYSDFRFTAAASSDPDVDTLTRAWRFTAFPDTSLAMLVPCAPGTPADLAVCFHADVAGRYAIALGVSDGTATVDAVPVTVDVAPDAPPCLVGEQSDFRVVDPAQPQPFSVTAMDDGDPWPAADPSYATPGFPRFTWKLRRPGDAWQPVVDYVLPSLTLAAHELTVGDQLEVRVEIADRVPRSLAACADEPTCALAAPDCKQRLTFVVEAR